MKKISLSLLALALTLPLAGAQETATQQQLDELRGHYQDAQEALRLQDQRIAALEKQLNELREKVNTPAPVSDSASSADLKKLAEQVQEIERKRTEDHEYVVKQLENLSKIAAQPVTPSTLHHSSSTPKTSDDDTSVASAAGGPHYEYQVKPGDTLDLIVKAYRDKGVKVTKAQVIAANKLKNPDVVIPGKTLIIPIPAAK